MPGRNIVRIDIAESFYHVYISARPRARLFRDDADYEYFTQLFARHLSSKQAADKYGKRYPHLRDDVALLAYVLMPNHVHLLLYQETVGGMARFMKAVLTSYSMYYNHKYHASGPLYASRYRASRLSCDEVVMQASRYIHLDPSDWMAYPHSSIHSYYLGAPSWLQPSLIIDLFGTLPEYADYLDDEAAYRRDLDELRSELASPR